MGSLDGGSARATPPAPQGRSRNVFATPAQRCSVRQTACLGVAAWSMSPVDSVAGAPLRCSVFPISRDAAVRVLADTPFVGLCCGDVKGAGMRKSLWALLLSLLVALPASAQETRGNISGT